MVQGVSSVNMNELENVNENQHLRQEDILLVFRKRKNDQR